MMGKDLQEITYKELVITCEVCRTVKKFSVKDYDECLNIFQDYQCQNGCGRNLYSFFTVGILKKKS